jgi:hypothetical protein
LKTLRKDKRFQSWAITHFLQQFHHEPGPTRSKSPISWYRHEVGVLVLLVYSLLHL